MLLWPFWKGIGLGFTKRQSASAARFIRLALDMQLQKVKLLLIFLPSDEQQIEYTNEALYRLALLLQELAAHFAYELPFEMLFQETATCRLAGFLFFGKTLLLSAREQTACFVEALAMLHFNILSLCASQSLTVSEADVGQAAMLLVRLASHKNSQTKGINLAIPFSRIKAEIRKQIQ